ncbi:ATP-grasp domain-containing protein [Nocardia anaemiae]|uniref:ATP-grasp domain-containing protein n=1 Tax=Nocardia anaemiae TaxID=263910 RepID=UPI0007A55A39|nr:ATP-grasp domain-containing protein [Nocardia anaemiae]
MEHILFVDMTQAGIHVLRRAVERGHAVTFIRGAAASYYHPDAAFFELLSRLDKVIDIPDTADADILAAAIERVHAGRRVDAVIGHYDPTFEALATACQRFRLPFASPEGVTNVRDKSRTRALIAQAGLASARYTVVDDRSRVRELAAAVGYPAVVKPVGGIDSVFARQVDGLAAAQDAVDAILHASAAPNTPLKIRRLIDRGIIIEEYVAGELVSAEIALNGDQCWPFLICGRSRGRLDDCVEVGAVLPAPMSTEQARDCFDYAEAVCRAVDLTFGVFHVEMLVTDHGPVLVEINPRAMGGVMAPMYKTLTGTDFCDYILDLHLGRKLRPTPLDSTTRTITSRRLMSARSATVPPDVDVAWATGSDSGLVSFESFLLKPGTVVGERDLLGRFVVEGQTWSEAMHTANDLLKRFEKDIGLPLIEPQPIEGAPCR